MTAEVLAIGAHPDDVELVIGGTLHKLAQRGYSVAVADLTRGEMGTRGDPETRKKEAEAAAEALGVTTRLNLGLPDGIFQSTLENRKRIIELIRGLRPMILFCPYWEDAHPDHATAGRLVCEILYPSGFEKYPAGGTPHRPHATLFYMSHFPFEPSLIIDTSGHFDAKQKAVYCYQSQLFNAKSTERETSISQPDFIKKIEARDRYFGHQIQKTFGEPFLLRRPVPIDDPVAHFTHMPLIA